MNKFIKFEDNEDGTTTITINLVGDDEITMIVPIALEGFLNVIPKLPEGTMEAMIDEVGAPILIPNDVGD